MPRGLGGERAVLAAITTNLRDMTISTFIRLTSTLTASFLLCATAALAQGSGAGIDDGSHWEPMFSSSGTISPTSFVELRFFGGLDNSATVEAQGMSLRSVERGWRTARAFLQREMEIDDEPPAT